MIVSTPAGSLPHGGRLEKMPERARIAEVPCEPEDIEAGETHRRDARPVIEKVVRLLGWK
jgi:hypothetical protein